MVGEEKFILLSTRPSIRTARRPIIKWGSPLLFIFSGGEGEGGGGEEEATRKTNNMLRNATKRGQKLNFVGRRDEKKNVLAQPDTGYVLIEELLHRSPPEKMCCVCVSFSSRPPPFINPPPHSLYTMCALTYFWAILTGRGEHPLMNVARGPSWCICKTQKIFHSTDVFSFCCCC